MEWVDLFARIGRRACRASCKEGMGVWCGDLNSRVVVIGGVDIG